MPSPPSSAIAGAAVAAMALADVLTGLARTLPATATTAQSSLTTARRVALIDAPRITAPSDVAAIGVSLISAVQALARDTAPADAPALLYGAATASTGCVPTSASPALTGYYALARALCASVQAACLGEAFLAEARTPFSDRQSASAARDRINAALEGAIDGVAAALGQRAAATITKAAGHACAYLTTRAGSLQPLYQVRAPRSFPAMALAWSLYADPSRAAELIAKNAVATPFFMPSTFEAIAPKKVN